MIEVYGAKGCGRCTALINNLSRREVQHIYLQHESDYTKDDLIKRTGRKQFNLPVCFLDGEEITYLEALAIK